MNDSLPDWNVATSKIGVKHLSICFPVSDCRQWLLEALPYVYKEEVFELISEKIKTLELDSGRAVSLIRGLALTPNPTEKMCSTVVVRKKAYALAVCAWNTRLFHGARFYPLKIGIWGVKKSEYPKKKNPHSGTRPTKKLGFSLTPESNPCHREVKRTLPLPASLVPSLPLSKENLNSFFIFLFLFEGSLFWFCCPSRRDSEENLLPYCRCLDAWLLQRQGRHLPYQQSGCKFPFDVMITCFWVVDRCAPVFKSSKRPWYGCLECFVIVVECPWSLRKIHEWFLIGWLLRARVQVPFSTNQSERA